MDTLINVVIAILALITCYIVWRIYLLTKANSILLILFAMLWALVFRLLLASTVLERATTWMLGFWILMPIGMYKLLRILKEFIKK